MKIYSKKIIVILILFLLIVLDIKAFSKLDINLNNKDDIKTEIDNFDKSNMFAILVYSSTYNDYIEYTGNSWPRSSEFNLEKYQCFDDYGEEVDATINYSGNNIVANMSKAAKCDLYFKEK